MSDPTILIVEDDPAMLRGLEDNFAFEGYRVLTAADGRRGYEIAVSETPDLVVLDVMLPHLNGYEACRRIRRRGLSMPIIMLTAKGDESDVILGLDVGADDYVTKPFSIAELLARVRAMLRRHHDSATAHRFGRFELDLVSHRLTADGDDVELTPKEFAVLAYLAERPRRAVSRDELLQHVWGHDVFVTPRSIDRCVNTLRKKIEADPHRPCFIQTVREVGYRFVGEDE